MYLLSEWFNTYYGLDVVAMVLTTLSIYLLGEKTRSGFVLGVFSQIAWFFINVWARILAGAVLNIILIVLNIRGYLLWRKGRKKL
ncbi:nicotinamide mononucleotide transporter [Candidatus Uhrbacteria bacterium]|nr:nicotinamide mononucleotide transporter [Candidatus Uhrbacteria bacterium]